MSALNIKKAVRENIWVKLALMAPSGGGKTYSALRIATGMVEALKEMGEDYSILMLNTEAARGKYYANEFQYDIVDVTSPHNPEKYVELLKEIESLDQNYIVILDSSSHEWSGKGGCLELHSLAGGTFQAWGKVTPRHDKFLEALADSQLHIIATMRGKDQYEIQKDDSGKTGVKKLGVGAKQREGFEYEFTATFSIDQQSNLAISQKDNTHIFEDEGEQHLTERHGKQLIEWANSGEGFTPVIRHSVLPEEKLGQLRKDVIALATELGGSDNEEVVKVVKGYVKSGNPNKISDVSDLENLKADLEKMKVELEEVEEKPEKK